MKALSREPEILKSETGEEYVVWGYVKCRAMEVT